MAGTGLAAHLCILVSVFRVHVGADHLLLVDIPGVAHFPRVRDFAIQNAKCKVVSGLRVLILSPFPVQGTR